jgi:hypothetical protein
LIEGYWMPAFAGMTDKGARRRVAASADRLDADNLSPHIKRSPRPETGAVRALALLAPVF